MYGGGLLIVVTEGWILEELAHHQAERAHNGRILLEGGVEDGRWDGAAGEAVMIDALEKDVTDEILRQGNLAADDYGLRIEGVDEVDNADGQGVAHFTDDVTAEGIFLLGGVNDGLEGDEIEVAVDQVNQQAGFAFGE